MTKTYVLDTSALINFPDIISTIKKHNVVIPGTVIRQLDYLKNNNDESVAWCSRKASRSIEKYQRRNRVKIMGNMRDGLVDMLHSGADNQIVATGIYLKRQGRDVCLLSTDRNMRIAARKYGMTAETGDDREILVKIWTFITWAVFSVPMLAIIALILPSFMTIPALTTDDVTGILVDIMFSGFAITVIPAMMIGWYSGSVPCQSQSSGDRDDIIDDIVTNPAWHNLGCNIYHHSDNDR